MRQWVVVPAAAALLVAALLPGCSTEGGPPREGDTVTPVLAVGLNWTAGQPGALGVHLEAQNQDGTATRMLNFTGIPARANPVATITFYQGDQPQPPVAVPLSHRC